MSIGSKIALILSSFAAATLVMIGIIENAAEEVRYEPNEYGVPLPTTYEFRDDDNLLCQDNFRELE